MAFEDNLPRNAEAPTAESVLNDAPALAPALPSPSALPPPFNPLLNPTVSLASPHTYAGPSSYAPSGNAYSPWNGYPQAPMLGAGPSTTSFHHNGYNHLRNSYRTGNAVRQQEAIYKPSDVQPMGSEAAFHLEKLVAASKKHIAQVEAEVGGQQDADMEDDDESDISDDEEKRMPDSNGDARLRAQTPLTSRMEGLSLRDPSSRSGSSWNSNTAGSSSPPISSPYASSFGPNQPSGNAFQPLDSTSVQSWMPHVESHIATAVANGKIPAQQHYGLGLPPNTLPTSTQSFVSSQAAATPPHSSLGPRYSVYNGEYTNINTQVHVTNHGLSGIMANNAISTTNNNIRQLQPPADTNRGEGVLRSDRRQARIPKSKYLGRP